MQPRIALCSVCHSQMPPSQPLCRNCGTILCPHCRVPLPQRSRFCPRCGFLCIPEEPKAAPQPMTPIVSARPQGTVAPRFTGPSLQPKPQASISQQPAVSPGIQNLYNCPKCGGSVDPASGRCSICGLHYGSKHSGIEQQVPRPAPAGLLPIPQQQGIVSYPSQANYSTRSQYNQPARIAVPIPTTFQPRLNYNPPNTVPHGRIQPLIPRPVPVATNAVPVAAVIPAPSKQYKPMSHVSREPGTLPPTRRAFARLTAIFLILIMCAFIGSGIYYAIDQSTASQNIISQREKPSRHTSPASSSPIFIPSISTSPTETGAVITWKTDTPVTSQVTVYDLNGAVMWTETNQAPATEYSSTISGLKPGITYRYTVVLRDAKGNEVTFEEKLTPVAQADTTPPVISGVNVSSITESSAIITWVTSEPATSQVEYGKTELYDLKTVEDTNLSTTHSVPLNRLDPDTTYYFKIVSKDANGNTAVLTSNQTFTTQQIIPVGYQIGNRAPDFTLKNLAGQDVTLSSFRGKILMVNFWATWCEPCVREMPHIQEVFEKWPRDRLVILAIHVKDHADTAQSLINDKRYTFPILLDLTGEAKSLYNVTEIPRTFFINANGIIKEIKYGPFRSSNEIENILNSL